MVEVILLDKEAVKQLKCSICLKRKADTIAENRITGNALACIPCIKYIDAEFERADKKGQAYPTWAEIKKARRD